MRKVNLNFTLLALLLTAVLTISACGSADETPAATEDAVAEVVEEATDVPVEPTEVPAEPTAVPEEPTEAPAEPTEVPAEPTAVPETPTEVPAEPTEEPTAVPEAPATFDIIENGITITVPTELSITDVNLERIPAQVLLDGPPIYLTDVPEYLRLTLDTPQGPATMLVRPIRDEAGDYYSSQQQADISYFNDFTTQLANEEEGRDDQKQLAYIEFGDDGTALRAVSYQFEAFGPQKITEETLYYFFDGITTNGRYYVNLAYPVDSGALDPSGDFNGEEFAAASADYAAYAAETLAPLDALTDADFTPSLEQLDEMVQSITIANDASTEVSPLANDPNCTNFAAYLRDVTINDGQIINPGQTFTKVWEIENTGTCNWTPEYALEFLDGSELGWNGVSNLNIVQSGDTLELSLDLIAPVESGIYQGRWQLTNAADEFFGNILYAAIFVPEEPIAITPTATPAPVLVEGTAVPLATPEPKDCTDDLTFVADVTIPDGTTINPGEGFTKVWEVRNAGTCTWDGTYSVAFSDGAAFSWVEGTTPVVNTPPSGTFEIEVQLTAPQESGIYEGRWAMVNDQGEQFGPLVYVTIFVPTEPIQPTPAP